MSSSEAQTVEQSDDASEQSLLRIQELEDQATIKREQGHYREAERLYLCALDLAEQELGPDDLTVATILNNLGVTYKFEGSTTRLRPATSARCRSWSALLGPDHPDDRHDLPQPGRARALARPLRRGEPFARRSVAIREQALGPDHPEVAADKAALAALLDGQGQYEEAEQLYHEAIAIYERAFGPQYLDLAVIYNNLAAIAYARADTPRPSGSISRRWRSSSSAWGRTTRMSA